MSTVAILSWVWFGFTSLMTLLMWAAQVNPDQAVFNLYHWARKCGIKDPPQWLRDRATDRKVRVGAYIALLVLAFFGGILFDNWLRPLTAEFPPTAAQSLSNKRIYFASDIDARIKAVDRLDAILVRFQPILMQSQEFWNRIRYMIQDGSASELLLKYANDTKPILEDLDAAILEYRLRFPELEKAINSPDYPYVRSISSSSLNLRSE